MPRIKKTGGQLPPMSNVALKSAMKLRIWSGLGAVLVRLCTLTPRCHRKTGRKRPASAKQHGLAGSRGAFSNYLSPAFDV